MNETTATPTTDATGAANGSRVQDVVLPPEDDWDCDFGETECCPECNGEGFVVVCCDDLCHARGSCMHGDGNAMCGNCMGTGEV
jgi:hypothetical protein